MVCYTLEEQNEIINEFLKVIDINDNKKLIRKDIENCRICKINLANTYFLKTYPTDIAKKIFVVIVIKNVMDVKKRDFWIMTMRIS